MSRRVRSVRWWGSTVFLIGLLLSLPAVHVEDTGRIAGLEVVLRVFFVPIGEVTNTPLLWTSRVVSLAGLVLIVVGNQVLHEPDV